MVGLELKLGFFDNEQAAEFLRLLRYMEWCGNVGHSAGITVDVDGDGNFRMSAFVKDPETGEYKPLKDMMKLDEAAIEGMKAEQREWQKDMPPDKRDRNEVSFCMGD